jgi:hypothetical protein
VLRFLEKLLIPRRDPSCDDCDLLFTAACEDCERAHTLLKALEDPMASLELRRWMDGPLGTST